MKSKVILMTLAVIASFGVVSSQTTQTTPTKSEFHKSCYVDANKNNVCDNYENKTCTKSNGNGQCDGSGKCRGQRFCCGNGTCRGQRQGQHFGKDNGKGVNFIDANKNGVCDNRETK